MPVKVLATLRQQRGWSIATIVVLCAIVVVCTVVRMTVIRSRSSFDRLVIAADRADYRPVQGRLIGFSYRPRSPVERRAELAAPSLQVLRDAADEVVRRNDKVRANSDVRATAIALLFLDDARSSVARLESEQEQADADPGYWTDMAAARYELARASGDSHQLAYALAAADRALAVRPQMPEALFNRALVLDAMGLHTAAVRAFNDFLRVEQHSDWAREARARASDLRAQPRRADFQQQRPRLVEFVRTHRIADARAVIRRHAHDARVAAESDVLGLWGEQIVAGAETEAALHLAVARAIGDGLVAAGGDPLVRDLVESIDRAAPRDRRALAEAYARYRAARLAYKRRSIEAALEGLRQSARMFDAQQSPMAHTARCYEAAALNDQQESRNALRIVMEEQAAVPERYRALRAHLLWQEGTIRGTLGMVVESASAYRRAGDLFASLGEATHAATVRQMMATHLFGLGFRAEAWRTLVAVFEELDMANDRDALQRALTGATRGEITEEHWHVARSLVDLTADLQLVGVNARREVYLWTQRAVASHHVAPADAADDIRRAIAAARGITSTSLRDAAFYDIRLVEAALSVGTDPSLAIQQLTMNIEWASVRNYTLRLPQQYVERARARLRGRDIYGARKDYDAALALIEKRSRETDAHSKSAMLDALDEVADELIVAYVDAGDARTAFALIQRTQDAIAAAPPRPHEAEAGSLPTIPPKHVLAHYRVLRERLLIFVAHDSDVVVLQQPYGRATVERVADSLNPTVTPVKPDDTTDAAAAAFELFVYPVLRAVPAPSTLIIVADEVLSHIPFAALRDTRTNRFLVEDMNVVYTRSARRFVESQGRRRSGYAVVVGDPAFDRERFPQLARLPSAATESRAVAALYDASPFTGDHATGDLLSTRLPGAAVFHFAGHAIVDESDGRNSCLLLAPVRGSSGAVYLHDLEKAMLRLDVAVLAGCRTAAPTTKRHALSLASALLDAGARSAVGSLWDVEDDATRIFSIRLHSHLAQGTPTEEAVRAAQLDMLRSGDPVLRVIRTWGAFQAWRG